MRVVVDTNVLVRAVPGRSSPARQLLETLLTGDHVLITSKFLLDELDRTLRYGQLRAIHGLDDAAIGVYVHSIRDASLVVDLSLPTVTVSTDPNDDPVIATAIEGQADVLCTWDRHLFAAVVQEYLARAGIRVLRDTALILELGTPPAPT